MNKLDKNSNCVYSLWYHFIVVVKYRQKVFTNNDIIESLKELTNKISEEHCVEIIQQECGIDHLHILFKAKPTLDITKYINALKGRTSRELRKQYQDFLKDKLWGDNFWSPSYYLATAGNISLDKLIQYVEEQRK